MYLWKKIEDDYHYFFTCPKYKDARNILFNRIHYLKFTNCTFVNTHVLLWGNSCLNIIYSMSFKPLSNIVVGLTNLYCEFLLYHDYYLFVSVCIYSFFFQNHCNMLYIHVYHLYSTMHFKFCVIYMYAGENDLRFQNLCSIPL
jgi:hypothetical protein